MKLKGRVLFLGMLLASVQAHADDLKLVNAARKQVGVTKAYDPAYSKPVSYTHLDVYKRQV